MEKAAVRQSHKHYFTRNSGKKILPKLILFIWKKMGRLHLKNYPVIDNLTVLKLKLKKIPKRHWSQHTTSKVFKIQNQTEIHLNPFPRSLNIRTPLKCRCKITIWLWIQITMIVKKICCYIVRLYTDLHLWHSTTQAARNLQYLYTHS